MMLNKINKNGIEAIWRNYKTLIIFLLFSLSIVFIMLCIHFKGYFELDLSMIDIISISIGMIGLILALWSIQSTTISLNEIQADYWNTRGLDNDHKNDYYNAYQAYDKAIDIDRHSLKFRINKANALLDQGRMYGDNSVLINALNIINEAIKKGPKYPATWRKNTLKEKKAKQEYANALKSKCDILLDIANISDAYAPQSLTKSKKDNFIQSHFFNPPQNCDLLRKSVLMEILPSSSIIRNCAFEISNEAIENYPQDNPQIPGAYVSKGNGSPRYGKA